MYIPRQWPGVGGCAYRFGLRAAAQNLRRQGPAAALRAVIELQKKLLVRLGPWNAPCSCLGFTDGVAAGYR